MIMGQLIRQLICLCLSISIASCLFCTDLAIASTSARAVQPQNGATTLNGNIQGSAWNEAAIESKIAFCNAAFAAFRGSPSQSYIISSNVQSLTPSGLCDRIDQYFSIEENLDTRISSAAAIAPLLFADTPLGTKYKQ